ncbi:helix-turn-helix transcriptional regulator [Paenibacillus larvae]
MLSFNTRLKDLRALHNLKQTDVANILGLGVRVIQAYESGDRTPPIEKMVTLADYFDVSLDYLVGRSDDPRRH